MPQCPIGCGECCDYWYEVFPDEPPGTFTCPHMGDHSCLLKYENRPKVCRKYLCKEARAQLQKLKGEQP